MSRQKLELTWIGKDQRPRLEPRILLEDPKRSYHAKQRVADGDLFDNQLIKGDNLLALKALEAEFAGKVKCVFIDPPYNTGSAFTHYDDGLEHSIWLGLMRDRLGIIRRLLADDGSLWITIDDNEAHYLKVMCDEVFDPNNPRSLLVCCGAYRGVTAAQAAERWPNLTIKTIPKMVKDRCEWGHDDYSLNVANLPMAQKKVEALPPQDDLFGAATGNAA